MHPNRLVFIRAITFALCTILFFFPTISNAELVLVKTFETETDMMVPCDLESVIAKRLEEWGCDVIRGEMISIPPDVIVKGDYWKSGENTFATIVAMDSVVGNSIFGRHSFIPEKEGACKLAARKIADGIASPPIPTRKNNLLEKETGMEFVFVPGGNFLIDYKGYSKRVSVENFLIGKYEVTQKEWEKIMGSNPSYFKGPDKPVENVSWYDVQEFIKKFREVSGLDVSLPTEIQWEFAARSRGRSWRWSGTNSQRDLDEYSWRTGNSERSTQKVGQKKFNGLGLYDMSGNVWEWCKDDYAPRNSSDPVYDESLKFRVIKGGSWMMDDMRVTAYSRDGSQPGSRSSDNGFRLVVRIEE